VASLNADLLVPTTQHQCLTLHFLHPRSLVSAPSLSSTYVSSTSHFMCCITLILCPFDSASTASSAVPPAGTIMDVCMRFSIGTSEQASSPFQMKRYAQMLAMQGHSLRDCTTTCLSAPATPWKGSSYTSCSIRFLLVYTSLFTY